MTIVRRLARPLLAAPFVQFGLEQLRHPMPTVEVSRPVLAPIVSTVADATGLPDDPELVVRASGALMAGSGLLLALGRAPRLSALVMTASALPTAYATGQFWKEQDPQVRQEKRRRVLATLGLVGGALLAAVDTEGRPGVAWRTRHAGESASKSAKRAAKDAKRTAELATKDAKRAAKSAKQSAKLAVHDAKASIG